MRTNLLKLLLTISLICSFVFQSEQVQAAEEFKNVYYQCVNPYRMSPSGFTTFSNANSVFNAREFVSDHYANACSSEAGMQACQLTHRVGHPESGVSIGTPYLYGSPPIPGTYGFTYLYTVQCAFPEPWAAYQVFDGMLSTPMVCDPGKEFNPYSNPPNCELACDPGETWTAESSQGAGNHCVPDGPDEPNKGAGGCGVGNPCDPATGNKTQPETDFVSRNGDLSITRTYNSINTKNWGIGRGWSSSLFKELTVDTDEIIIWQTSGRAEVFTSTGGGLWTADADSDLTLTETSEFVITDESEGSETYNASGLIQSETSANGKTTSYSYDSNDQLISVTNHFGQSITINWDGDGYVESIIDPHGGIYTYVLGSFRNLSSVQYPDGSTRTYHYENASFPHHLTGITDENGVRYATFAYDAQGRAISTEHADIGTGTPQEKFQIDYGQ